ncbi:hypothetical protein GGX14DRAFT_347386 [Mycena pura]|uniref:Bromo domain-containing protein n=1 Tax=Mycena pura TaxID=153505 RepID=A0AAD6YRF7_9AGAR|nr:hypothetical protein GGX14DRAFT_347386 [Mycena pura]
MEDFAYDSSTDSHSESPSPSPPPQPLPKLTLVLPPLKDLKKKASSSKGQKSKSKSKSKSKQPFAYSEYADTPTAQKVSRPVKLKPLKEVLSRLVVQLKKKDDYAFFLKPVNTAKVPGYTDAVKRPMDLGTMTIKVQRGRYRSLEEFTADFRLVTGNAKLFNPQGSIYYTEADRLESWGLEQIAKVSSTVIQYETDWNIEIERDVDAEDGAEEDYSAALEDAEMQERSRSPSVGVSSMHSAMLRRGLRGPYNKTAKENPDATVAAKDVIDPEGRLPGSKDGLGAFPAGSDWARTMLTLKLKGKRYKTKKERLRIETHGPPYLPDGSLDYFQVEDPFTYLSALVPDAPTRPQLVPIYPPPPVPQGYAGTPSRDTPSTPAPQPLPSYPLPTLLAPPYPVPPAPPPTLRHWTVQRNASGRRARDEPPPGGEERAWEEPREAHALDFGSFAELASVGVALSEGREDADAAIRDAVRASVEVPSAADEKVADDGAGAVLAPGLMEEQKEYWSTAHALEAEEYLRDVVYGGVDGLAYVRSLAEFVTTSPLDRDTGSDDEADVDGDVKMSMDVEPINEGTDTSLPLGCTLASWVAHNVVGPLTEGRQDLLRRTAQELSTPSAGLAAADDDKVPAQVALARHVRPHVAAALASLQQIHSYKLDLAALIQTPADVAQSEAEWAGAVTGAGLTPSPEQTNAVLLHTADVIGRLQAALGAPVKHEADGESSDLRNLRLNLLALVRRAPVATIAMLPQDLVPEQLRPYVPTLPSSSVAAAAVAQS